MCSPNEKLIIIVLNLYGDVKDTYIRQTIENLQLLMSCSFCSTLVISWSNPPERVKEVFTYFEQLFPRVVLLKLPKMGSGKQRNATLNFVIHNFPNADYIVYLEEDIKITEMCYINRLINLLDRLPENVVILSPEPATRLCLDLAGRVITGRDITIGLTGGFGMFIIRTSALKHLVKKGLETYSPYMYFYMEDKEFIFKLWQECFLTVSVKTAGYTHYGGTVHSQPLYRRYTRYLGPLLAILINAPLKLVILVLIFRSLKTLIQSMIRSELYLYIRSFIFILRNIKYVLLYRYYRLTRYRCRERLKLLFDHCIVI